MKKNILSKLSLVLIVALLLGLCSFTAAADEMKITRAYDKTTGAVYAIPEDAVLVEGVNYPSDAVFFNGTVFADWIFYSDGMPAANNWNQTPLWVGQTVNIGVNYHYQYPGQATESVNSVIYRWFAQNDFLWVTARPIPAVDQIIGVPYGYTAKWVNSCGEEVTYIANNNWHFNFLTFDNLIYPFYYLDCYAVFTPIKTAKIAKVLYVGPNQTEIYLVGDEVTVHESYEIPGKIFTGWTDGENFYKPGDKFIIDEDTELTPVYEDDPQGIRTITYIDGVDGKAFTKQVYQTVRQGNVPKFSGTPSYKNHLFKGWNYINLDTGFNVNEEDLAALMGNANIQAVAQWVETGSTGDVPNFVYYVAMMLLVGASVFVVIRGRRQR